MNTCGNFGWTLALLLVVACAPTPTPAPSADFQTYALDTSDIIQVENTRADRGALVISHNAVAVFPFDLRAVSRTLGKTGNTTILEIQTKSSCDNSGRIALADDHPLVRNLMKREFGAPKFRDAATLRRLTIEMPYHVKQDAFTRVPSTFCVGYHYKGNGWTWDFTPHQPTLDDARKIAFADIALNEKNVDAVGILFDATVAISRLTFEAKKE